MRPLHGHFVKSKVSNSTNHRTCMPRSLRIRDRMMEDLNSSISVMCGCSYFFFIYSSFPLFHLFPPWLFLCGKAFFLYLFLIVIILPLVYLIPFVLGMSSTYFHYYCFLLPWGRYRRKEEGVIVESVGPTEKGLPGGGKILTG